MPEPYPQKKEQQMIIEIEITPKDAMWIAVLWTVGQGIGKFLSGFILAWWNRG